MAAVRLSVPSRSCLGCRHAGCLQLSHRRPLQMCGLRTRPRTVVDPPRFLPPSNCHQLAAYCLGDTLLIIGPHRMHGLRRCGLLLQMWRGLSVCLLYTTVSPAQTTELTDMPLEM